MRGFTNTTALRLAVAGLVCCGAAALGGCETTTETTSHAHVDPLDEFGAGIDRAPTPKTLYRMAGLLASQGKDAEAEAVLRNAIERYPDFRPAYAKLAEVQIRRRRPEQAMNTLEIALGDAPNDPVLRNNLGMCHLLMENYASALREFTRASQSRPDDARYRANMALATGMLGNYDESLALYSEIMDAAEAHHNVAVICEARDDHERADVERAGARGATR